MNLNQVFPYRRNRTAHSYDIRCEFWIFWKQFVPPSRYKLLSANYTPVIRKILLFISVINKLDAQNFCFTKSLFHASTCFQHMCSKHVEAWNKLIVKQKFCASSRLITEINILRCTVSKTSKNHKILLSPGIPLLTTLSEKCECVSQMTEMRNACNIFVGNFHL